MAEPTAPDLTAPDLATPDLIPSEQAPWDALVPDRQAPESPPPEPDTLALSPADAAKSEVAPPQLAGLSSVDPDGVASTGWDAPSSVAAAPPSVAPVPAEEAAPDTASESAFEQALIHPDTSIVRVVPPRPPDDFEQVMRGAPQEPEGPIVTGIGESPRSWENELRKLALEAGDPHVAELTRMIRKLSDGLTTRGEIALRATPDLTPFETTLRAYCVGFLSRAREGRDR